MRRGNFRPRLLSRSRGQGFLVEYFLSFALFLFVFVSVLVLLVQTLLPRVDDSRFYTNTMMARRAALQLLTEEAGYVQWWNKHLNTRVLLNITDQGGERSSHRWVNITGQQLDNAGIDISVIDLDTLEVYEQSYMTAPRNREGEIEKDAIFLSGEEIRFKLFLGDLRSVNVHLYFNRTEGKDVVPVEKVIANTEKDRDKDGLADGLKVTANAPVGAMTGKGRTFDYAISSFDVRKGKQSQIISVTWSVENAIDYLTVGNSSLDYLLNKHPFLDFWYKVTGTDNPFNLTYTVRHDRTYYSDRIELYPLDANDTGVWRHFHMNLEDAARTRYGIGTGLPIYLSSLFINLTDAERDRWEGSTFVYFDDITLTPPEDIYAETGDEGSKDKIQAIIMETLKQAHWLARNEIPESFGFTTDGTGRTLNHTSIVRFRELQSIDSYEELKYVLGIDKKYHIRIKIVRPVSRNVINVTTDETIYDYGTNRSVHINIIMPLYVTDKWPKECTFPSYTSADPCILVVLLRPDGTSTTLVVPYKETMTEKVETRYFTDKDTAETGDVVFSRLGYATDYNLTITDPAGTYGIQVYALSAEPRGLLHGYNIFSLAR